MSYSRIEHQLRKLLGENVDIPAPQSRIEQLLKSLDKPISTATQTALDKKADLDDNGKVLSAQLPNYVDIELFNDIMDDETIQLAKETGFLPDDSGGNMLNQILRGLMRKSDVVGKVHTGTKLVDTVRRNTLTKISSVTVPPGTYAVTGNVAWEISDPAKTVYGLMAGKDQIAVARGDMASGGGDCLAAVVTVTRDTELYIEALHTRSEETKAEIVRLQAIRIK